MSADSKTRSWNLLFVAWIVSLIATSGSLFFSEIMHFPPCSLCWYQRIAMYPLVIVILAGLFPFDRSALRYALPLSLIGWATSVYHNLVSLGIIPESASPCSQGVSCATKYIQWFGFITIPLLSFIAFTIIIFLLFYIKKKDS